MPVKKFGTGDDARWHTVDDNGNKGKRGFLTRKTAEAAVKRGKELAARAAGSGTSAAPQKPRSTPVARDVGTRSKTATTVAAKVAMEPVYNPRASDLAGLLEGFVSGLQPGVAPPDFTSNPTQDSDDVQVGRAMGEALGAYMRSVGMTADDWKKLRPKELPETSIFDSVGLGGGAIEAVGQGVLGLAGQAAGGVLSGVTFGLLGGDDALIDVVPGDQTGPALSVF